MEEQKTVLLSISLAVHTFLADLSTSSHVDTQHKALANQLKQEVVELYSLWDLCHHQTSGEFSKVEACLQQLSQVLLAILKSQISCNSWKPRSSLSWVSSAQSSVLRMMPCL